MEDIISELLRLECPNFRPQISPCIIVLAQLFSKFKSIFVVGTCQGARAFAQMTHLAVSIVPIIPITSLKFKSAHSCAQNHTHIHIPPTPEPIRIASDSMIYISVIEGEGFFSSDRTFQAQAMVWLQCSFPQEEFIIVDIMSYVCLE